MAERRLGDAVQSALGARPRATFLLGGGDISKVYRLEMPDGAHLVAKLGKALDIEGSMLRYLAEHSALPVPQVLHVAPGMLITEYLENDGAIDAAAEIHAAELLAALHSLQAPALDALALDTPAFGFDGDTLIGGLRQPNPWTGSWRVFFRDQRLLHMARESVSAGKLPAGAMRRIEKLADRLERWIEEPEAPSLLHGDMWAGNVLVSRSRITGFVDPAIYYGDPEIELAFSTLFGTFGDPFFTRYGELRPLKPGFFEERRDLYNLYPLLVHVRLFGGSYVSRVDSALNKFGV